MNDKESIPQNTEGISTEPLITDMGLAREMAWAEVPFRVMADKADELDLDDNEVERFKKLATVNGYLAGKAYIQAQRDYADELEVQLKIAREQEGRAELEAKVEMAREALAKKYEQYGVTPDDFGLVEVGDRNGEIISRVVMLTSQSGIDLGDPNQETDYNRSFSALTANSNDERFKVYIDGIIFDTRDLTRSVYIAFVFNQFVTQPLVNGLGTLPDPNGTVFDERNLTHTSTWMLGEDEPMAGRTIGNGVETGNLASDYSVSNVLFRPTITIWKITN